MSKVVDAVVDSTQAVDNQKLTEIGARMKAARGALGLTQEGLALAVGGSKRGIQENEARNRVPGGEVVAGMIGLGINANWLLTGDGPMLLADLEAARRPALARINVDALEAIIEGALKVAKNAPASAIAAHAASVYAKCIDDGLITPDGVGEGNLDAAA